MTTHRTTATRRLCPECGRTFMNARYLREHRAAPFSHLTAEQWRGYTFGFPRTTSGRGQPDDL